MLRDQPPLRIYRRAPWGPAAPRRRRAPSRQHGACRREVPTLGALPAAVGLRRRPSHRPSGPLGSRAEGYPGRAASAEVAPPSPGSPRKARLVFLPGLGRRSGGQRSVSASRCRFNRGSPTEREVSAEREHPARCARLRSPLPALAWGSPGLLRPGRGARHGRTRRAGCAPLRRSPGVRRAGVARPRGCRS